MVRRLAGRWYYGWAVVAVTFTALVVSAGVRSAPGIFIHPLETDLGWDRAAIAFGVSIGLLLYGFSGPFAGRIMDRFGPRRVMLAGLLMIAASTAASAAMATLWQFDLLWGLANGVGTGALSGVLAVAVANRWFVRHRGLVTGLFGGATSAGQLVFAPLLMWLVVAVGWRISSLMLAILAVITLLPVWLLMRDDPSELGLAPYGGSARVVSTPAAASLGAILGRATRVPEFWLLAGSFFICGATSNGLIGTHLIPHSIDRGYTEMAAAGALALMGGMNFVGTMVSGWLTDRFDPRKLLAWYYSLRGLSLFLLPFVGDFAGLAVFAVIFGLDYVATVPPTANLAADVLGRKNVGTVFGLIFLSHQVGAATAAYLGGVARAALGDYQLTFLAAGALAIIGGLLALRIKRPAEPAAVAAVDLPVHAGKA